MKDYWLLAGSGPQALRLRYRRSDTPQGKTVRPVLTVREVCGRLRKSRRQVYRYLREGRLTACAHILGQWFFAPEEVGRFARSAVPRWLQRFFWDARVASLSVDRHRDYILARLLEFGDRQALRWALHTYPRSLLRTFLLHRGREMLSKRTWTFWALYLGVNAAPQEHRSWRARAGVWRP